MRAALILSTALLFMMPSASAQNAPDVNTMPLDQLARAIAHTIEVSTVRSPDAPLTFDGATVQGTKVIILTPSRIRHYLQKRKQALITCARRPRRIFAGIRKRQFR
jgi:hypothetical protein